MMSETNDSSLTFSKKKKKDKDTLNTCVLINWFILVL